MTDFSEERHGEQSPTPGMPGFWCDWAPTPDGMAIQWNGNEKFYHSPDWMRYIIGRFLRPWGIVANGVIRAQGEDMDDRWHLVVNENEVSVRRVVE